MLDRMGAFARDHLIRYNEFIYILIFRAQRIIWEIKCLHTYNYKPIYLLYIYLRRRRTCINSISSTIELSSLLFDSSRRYATQQKTADAIKFNNFLVDMNLPLSGYSEYDYSASNLKCAFVYTVQMYWHMWFGTVLRNTTHVFTLFAFVLTGTMFFF